MNDSVVKKEQGSTQSSLLRRIKNLSDAPGWNRFHEIYAPLIERFASKAGLNDVESQEVAQNTMLHVAKEIPNFNYDRAKGSFKTWLFNCVKWRIIDSVRARPKNLDHFDTVSSCSPGTSERERHEPGESVFEKIWDAEWQEQLRRQALDEVKKKVSGSHFQIFCLHVIEGLEASKVAEMVGVTAGQVYLIKYRLGRLIKKEMAVLNRPAASE
jgi:RNA polymerase sigma-70 factor (ECF subfamily)